MPYPAALDTVVLQSTGVQIFVHRWRFKAGFFSLIIRCTLVTVYVYNFDFALGSYNFIRKLVYLAGPVVIDFFISTSEGVRGVSWLPEIPQYFRGFTLWISAKKVLMSDTGYPNIKFLTRPPWLTPNLKMNYKIPQT